MSMLTKVLGQFPFSFKRAEMGPIGIDIRSHSLNLVQMSLQDNDTAPTIQVAVSIPLPHGSAEILASPKLFKQTLSRAFKDYPVVGKRCVTTLPGNQVKLQHMAYESNPKQDDMQALLPRLRELLGDKLESTVIDYIPIRSENGNQTSRSAIVATTARSDVERYLKLLNDCGIEVDSIEVGPLSLRRLIAAMNPDDFETKILTMNVCYEKSYLTVIWGRRILLDREVNFGLKDVLDAVASELNLTTQKATDLLNKYGFDYAVTDNDRASESEEMHQMLKTIVSPVFTKFAAKIRDVLLYIASETRGGGIDEVYVLGSIAHWHGIGGLLQQTSSIPVKVIDPFYGFARNEDSATNLTDLSGLAVAAGMSLKGLVTDV